MTHLDGNVLAGGGADLFTFETTTATGQCDACEDVATLAEAMVYGGPMGLVARCRNCDAVLVVIVDRSSRAYLDMRGLRWVRTAESPTPAATAP